MMDTRRLGRTGLEVSPLCLGGNVFGWTADEVSSQAILDAFLDGGGNFVDTADVYSTWAPGHKGGESEEVLGRWMKARGNRSRVVLATKVGGRMGPGPNEQGLSRRRIMSAVEDSLRRLQADYIDLYQAHFDDPDTPIEETVQAFDDLVHQGKVRYLGASNYSAWRLTRALWESDKRNLARFACLQPFYNVAGRADFERELEPLCWDQGLGVIPYSSLASGFLSGKYRAEQPLPETARASGVQRRYMNERGFAVLSVVEGVSKEQGATMTQVALAWLLARPSVTAPIVSATSVAQLHEILGAADLTLPPDAVTALDKASDWQEDSGR
jgi:aryl-alcohol dehydrogenase-like predicted oxidoreductase